MQPEQPRKSNWKPIALIGGAIFVLVCGLACLGIVLLGVSSGSSSQPPLSIGSPAPDFTLPALHGDAITLSAYEGRPVLISFGATWCTDCQREAPQLESLYKRHSDVMVVLLVDVQEDSSTVQDFADQYHLTMPIVLDGDGRVNNQYHIYAIPTLYFIDRLGVIRYHMLDYDAERAREGLAAIGVRE